MNSIVFSLLKEALWLAQIKKKPTQINASAMF